MQEKFMLDLEVVYEMLEESSSEVQSFYECLNSENEKREFLDEFLRKNHIKIDEESRYAIASRIVSLRDDSLIQVLKKQHFDEDEIVIIRDKSYVLVKEFYLKKHFELIKDIEKKELLSPFYREVLKGVHNIGLAMSIFQISWNSHIINGVNKRLLSEFGDNEKVMQMLNENNLLDKGHSNELADRCYSVLREIDGKYESVAYAKVFIREINEVLKALGQFKKNLFALNDEIFNQKREYIAYLDALELAFSEVDIDRLIERWADVDRAWMRITTPIQIGHPLEYYEDHYRKAVAPEWDVRIINPKLSKNERVDKIKEMYEKIFNSLDIPNAQKIYDISLQNLNKTQIYLGRPALFYGAEFNGLFSAQVVPNDEVVSSEYGKKIFAFADKVLQEARAKPFMKLPKVIFGEKFIKKERKFLFQESEKWHKIYDITTIGHEYGHILWMDEDSETLMNKSGNFKNIEEFKATTGGLVSFFMNEEDELGEKVLIDTIKRSISLIGWMEVDEVKPYYCEGLIHLDILFNSGVLEFKDKKLILDINRQNYEKTKESYIKIYSLLAKFYLQKKDATEFLNQFITKNEYNFMPKNEKIKAFVEYYYELYKEIGREIDKDDCKENYLYFKE